tara:strand:- start:2611 stop:3096 length:486 start_codon:yes stop_codon:yes gene_type:complete
MEVITIQKKIILESSLLNSNILENLFLKLKENITCDCTKEYGYILNVVEIKRILDHKIERSNSNNIFFVEFTAEVLKPKEGLEIEGIICMIYKDGIFLNIMEKQKMLIPKSNLANYKFEESGKKFVHIENDKSLKNGDQVKAIITAVGYDNKKYSCFGKLI